MPFIARPETALSTPRDGWAPAPVDPPPPGQLLRTGGGGLDPDRLRAGAAVPRSLALRVMDRDVDLVLAVVRGRPVPAAWTRPGFAARVEKVRGQLAPLHDTDVLAASFAGEALHARPWTPRPSAVRVAYAIRAVELGSGVELPRWPTILGSWTPAPGR